MNDYVKAVFATMLVAALPIVELAGAIPVGLAAGLSYPATFLAALAGNMLPVPFVILFSRKLFAWLRSLSQWLNGLVTRFEERAMQKAEIIRKYALIGLTIFVAIPLPGTGGAWTAAVIVAILGISMRKAVPLIAFGLAVAGVLMCLISYGAISVFGW